MAIFHCSVRTISRSDNHSAVAAAAYRSGSILKDERTGQSHNYRNRKGIVNAFILLPPNAPEIFQDRFTLWNAAESAEKRKNSRVAREVILALPHELSESQRLALTKDMALFLVEKYGVAVDCAVHAPQEAKGDDPRNHHAHLLFLTRVVERDGLGEKTRILDDKKQGPVQIELIRSVWEILANAALQQAGFDNLRIDRRTLEDQGIDRIPQEHVGKAGTHGNTPADDDEEPRTKDEEEDDGETGTTGKAGSGDKALTPSADKKEPSSSKQSRAAKEKRFDRLTLNEEIKRLNAQRAAFSPVPLKYQIKELERLMDRLDGRVQRLKLLSQKTSLPVRVLSLVKSVINVAKSLLVVRTKDEAARNLSAAERDTKAERQQARYGRTYRANVQERLADMRENMEILQTRKTQYQNYKSFVEMVEQRVKLIHSTLKAPALPARTEWKATTSSQVIRTKIVTESLQKREKVPVEYKPTLKSEPLTKNYKAVITNSVSPVAMNNSTKSVKDVFHGEYVRPKKVFTLAATATEKDNTAHAIWHKEVTVKIQSLDQARSERAQIIIEEPMESSKVWLVEANYKGKIILKRIQADIRMRKAEMPKSNPDGFSGVFNNPSRSTTDEETIQKVRTEAKAARTKVPPDMRAEPYGERSSKPESSFSSTSESAEQNVSKEKSAKMSSSFNELTLQRVHSRNFKPSPTSGLDHE